MSQTATRRLRGGQSPVSGDTHRSQVAARPGVTRGANPVAQASAAECGPGVPTHGLERELYVVARRGLPPDNGVARKVIELGLATPELNTAVMELVSGVRSAARFREQEMLFLVNSAAALLVAGDSRAFPLYSSTLIGSNDAIEVMDKPRYKELAKRMSRVAMRPVVGSHYHGGFPDIEDRIQARTALSAYEPFLTAFCAASPFQDLAYTGFESSRVESFSTLATAISLAPVKDAAEYLAKLERELAIAGHLDTSRLHPFTRACFRKGETQFDPKVGNGQETVEVRTPDNPLNIDYAVHTALLVAGLMSRTAHYLETGQEFAAQIDHESLRTARLDAARVGMNETLVDPFVKMYPGITYREVHAPAWEVAAKVFEEARKGLERIERLDPLAPKGSLTSEFDALCKAIKEHGTGAQRVRAMHDRIHAAQKAKGIAVPDLEAFYSRKHLMADSTARALQAALIWESHNGSLGDQFRQRSERILDLTNPNFPNRRGLSMGDTSGKRLITSISGSLARNYEEDLILAGIDLDAAIGRSTSRMSADLSEGPLSTRGIV